MKKLFGGKKKKESKATPFLKATPECHVKPMVSRKLNLVQSTEQQHLVALMNGSSINDNDFMHSKSQEVLTTAPLTQSILTKRLVPQPTKSPPALVMPRPRYAEPPTRAVLQSYEHDKVQLDPEDAVQLLAEQKGGGQSLDQLSSSDQDTFKHTRSSHYGNRKSVDLGARKNGYGHRDSIASNGDSNQAYESTIVSTPASTLMDDYGPFHRSAAALSAHSSGDDDIKAYDMTQPSDFNMAPRLASEHTPHADQLQSLQQKLKLLQKQHEMDRMEYGQMEQALAERTRWMNAEMDRTQNRIMALKRVPQVYSYDDSISDELYYYEPDMQATDYDDDSHWTQQRQPPLGQHRQVRKSKSGDSLPCLSRSSSRTSNGGRSSISGNMAREQVEWRSYRSPQHETVPLDRRRQPKSTELDLHYPLDRPCSRARCRSVERPRYYPQVITHDYSDDEEQDTYLDSRRYRYVYTGSRHYRMQEDYWPQPVLPHRYTPTFRRRRSSLEYIM